MKKDVKIWCLMVILVVVASGIVAMASAGFGIIPDMEEEKLLSSSVTTLKAVVEAANATDMHCMRSIGVEHIKSPILNYTCLYLNVKPQNVIKGDNVEFSAVLYDLSGKLVVNKALKFYVDGNFIESRKTDSGRVLTSYDTSNLAIGAHEIKVVFEGDFQYRQSSERETFMVSPSLWEGEPVTVRDIPSNYTRIKEKYVENAITNATFSSASFTDDYNDYGVDADGDGKYDYLAIDVDVDVKNAGRYRIEGSLKDSSTGDHIVGTSTDKILDVGVHEITLRFNGYQIYRHGTSGRFDLKDLEIYDKDWNTLDYRDHAYTTSYYSYTYFDVPPADITGSYSNYGIDTDSDGKYNYLAIDVWVNVKEAGYYSLGGWLDEDGNKYITHASTGSHLNKGLQKLTLKFNGYELYRRGVNSQFVLGSVELKVRSGDDWDIVDQKWDAYTTSFYYYTGFDKPPADLTGSYSHYGIDADGDGKYDYLAVEVRVNVKENGYYNLEGWLEDCYGYYITYGRNHTYLEEGMQKLTLEFNGYEIYRHGVSGSLGLGHVKLLDYGWKVIEEKWDVYSTSYYAYTNFDTPPIDFTGAYADYGVDTDGNGEYDYLVVEVGVNVKEAGTYSVSGGVYDNENDYITSNWAEAELSTGLQKFTLKFDGRKIYGHKMYKNGVDGPFNLGYVEMYDGWNRIDYKYDAYVTSYYNYTEFEEITPAAIFDIPGTIVIGKVFDVRGYANTGAAVDVFINNVLYAPLNDLVIDEGGDFEAEVIANNSIGMGTPGTVKLKVWINCPKNPGDAPPAEPAHGEIEIVLVEPTAEFAPGFNDYGLDTDDNSLYDYLVIEKEINVREAGNYRLYGSLGSPSGEGIDSDYNYTHLDVGLHSIKLRFYGPSIYNTGESGNFVVEMNLYDTDEGRCLDSTTNTTSYYSYTDFERPSAEFTGNFNDYGLDTDEDTSYNCLVIESEIAVKKAGEYRLYCTLRTASGEWVSYDWNETHLDVGIHDITSEFSGLRIYNLEYNGSFKAELELYAVEELAKIDEAEYLTAYYNYTDFDPVIPPAIVSLTANPNMDISKDNPAVINATIIGDYLEEIILFSGEKVESNETTNIHELRSIEWIPSDEWSSVGNKTYNITEEWNATAIGSYVEEDGGFYIGCYYATDGINETYPLIWELPAGCKYNEFNRTLYGTELSSSFLHNGTWYDDATIMYFPDTDKVEVVYVSHDLVFLNTTDPELIEEYPDAKSLDPNSKCKFINLLIITDTNGTIIEDPFRYGEETRKSKEFRIGDLKIKKNTPLPAGEYLIGMNVEDEAGNRDIDGTIVFTAGITKVFDTGAPSNPYPSIAGTHTGTIMPNRTITVNKLYTYPCAGTGGHTESIELYDENGNLIASGNWNGYQQGDWHNITITPSVTLLKDNVYRYIIKTGSYPQIIHTKSKDVTGGTITCDEFIDANGKVYYDWIPAIILE